MTPAQDALDKVTQALEIMRDGGKPDAATGYMSTLHRSDLRELALRTLPLIPIIHLGLQEWQGIGMASKELTECGGFHSETIIGKRGNEIHTCHWSVEYPLATVGDKGAWVYAECGYSHEGDEDGIGMHLTWEPTHWMPLPKPPTKEPV